MNSGKCYPKTGIIAFSKFANEKVWAKSGPADWSVDNKYCSYRGHKSVLITSVLNCLTPVPGDPVPSSGLHKCKR